jgi:hypothetical protein
MPVINASTALAIGPCIFLRTVFGMLKRCLGLIQSRFLPVSCSGLTEIFKEDV